MITARSGTLETLADMARSAVSAEEIRLETMVPMDREDSRAAVSQKKISICVLLQTIYAAVITERLLMYWTGLKTGARFGIFTAHPLIPDWAITLRLLNRRKRRSGSSRITPSIRCCTSSCRTVEHGISSVRVHTAIREHLIRAAVRSSALQTCCVIYAVAAAGCAAADMAAGITFKNEICEFRTEKVSVRNLHLSASNGSNSQTARPHMSSDTHCKREVYKFHIGKILSHFILKFLQFIRIHHRVGNTCF